MKKLEFYIAPEAELLVFASYESLCAGNDGWFRMTGDEVDGSYGIELPEDEFDDGLGDNGIELPEVDI